MKVNKYNLINMVAILFILIWAIHIEKEAKLNNIVFLQLIEIDKGIIENLEVIVEKLKEQDNDN